MGTLKEMKGLQWNVMLVLIRYLLIGILILTYISFYEESDALHLSLLLLFIINNQLRFFTLENKSMIIISLLIDMILIYSLYQVEVPFFSIFFLLSVIDTVTLCNEKPMMVLSGIFTVQMFLMYFYQSTVNFAINLVFLLICILMIYQLKIQFFRKTEAQKLYDQLRKKEEELVELNMQLEKYASTVENLTLLRERNRITREIHDDIGHRLSTSIIQLGAIEKMITLKPDKASEMIHYLREYQQESLQNVRSTIHELKPKQFERYEGLLTIEQLIKNFEKLTAIKVKMSILNEESLTWPLKEKQIFSIYRVIQESLSNSLRHGKAEHINISFNFQEDSLILIIRDDGTGDTRIVEGNGIANMKQRIKELGGQLKYEASEGQGFFLVGTIPKEGGKRDGNESIISR